LVDLVHHQVWEVQVVHLEAGEVLGPYHPAQVCSHLMACLRE
jgi:hypothetical protein